MLSSSSTVPSSLQKAIREFRSLQQQRFNINKMANNSRQIVRMEYRGEITKEPTVEYISADCHLKVRKGRRTLLHAMLDHTSSPGEALQVPGTDEFEVTPVDPRLASQPKLVFESKLEAEAFVDYITGRIKAHSERLKKGDDSASGSD